MVILLGCAEKGRVRSSAAVKATKPPKIERQMDLGGLPVLRDGNLTESLSDGRYTPGEWVAIIGDQLSDADTQVTVGGVEVPVAAHLDDRLLIRLPRRLPLHQAVDVVVKTPMGEDSVEIHPQSYLVVSDPHANEVRFFRSVATETDRGMFEPECDAVALNRARFHVVSRSGAFLYAIASAKDSAAEEETERELMVIHMGAKDHPLEMDSATFPSVDGPTDMALDGAMAHLLVLTQTELLVFDVQEETKPKLQSQLFLSDAGISDGGYTRMAILKKGDTAVLLDAVGNRLTVVDLSQDSQPRIVTHINTEEGELPRVVDLVADRADDRTFHVIEGPNLRLAKEMFHKYAPKLLTHIQSRDASALCRVVTYRLEGDTVHRHTETRLPKGTIPLHILSEMNGDLLVSAVDFSVTKLTMPDSLAGGVRMMVGVFTDAIQMGTVFRIGGDGRVSKVATGVSLFLTMADVPGGNGLVSLVMRIAVKKFPPSVGVKLSIDTLDEHGNRVAEQLLRNLSWTFLIPPYSTPIVSFQ
jgi:hypothetical protein